MELNKIENFDKASEKKKKNHVGTGKKSSNVCEKKHTKPHIIKTNKKTCPLKRKRIYSIENEVRLGSQRGIRRKNEKKKKSEGEKYKITT